MLARDSSQTDAEKLPAVFGVCDGDLRANFALLLGDAPARTAYFDEAGRPGRMDNF